MIRVRPREARDLPGCRDLVWSVHRSDAYPTVVPDDVDGWITPKATSHAWVADVDERIVGHIALRDGASDDSPWAVATGIAGADMTMITRFLVDVDYRKLGVGKELFDLACASAVEQARLPVLDVLDKNLAAIGLYEHRGWKRIDSHPWTDAHGAQFALHYYLPPDEFFPAAHR